MKRVLRITAGLMGLWLIFGVGGLAIVRAREKPQPLMLVIAPTDTTLTSSSLYLARFGSRFHYKLHSGYPIYVGRGWSPDGEWFYWVGIDTDSDFPLEHVWRVSRDGRTLEQLARMHYPEGATWTTDGQGLLAFLGVSSLFRIKPDGSSQENLTPNFDQVVKMYSSQCPLTVNAEWIYFCAGREDSGGFDVFRLGQDGQLNNLTPNLELPTGVIAQPQSGEWAIIQDGWGSRELYIVASDNNDLKPLFPEWLANKAIYNVQWIPAANLLIVDAGVNLVQRTLNGFDMINRRLLWQNDGMELVTVTSDQWVVAILNQTTLVRMRPDGTALAHITGGVDYRSYMGLSPDGQWVIYSQIDLDSHATDWWGVPLMGGQPHRILHISTRDTYAKLMGWTPDQQWMLLNISDGMSNQRQWVKLDGSEVRPLVEWGDAQFLTWLGPINRNWQPIGLIILGAVLEIGLIGWPKKRKPRPG